MKKVVLNKMDTCLSYVLKRVGCFNLYPLDYDKLTDGGLFEVLAFNQKKLREGNIILWDSQVYKIPMPTEITKNGKLIFNQVFQGFHCAVYEGNGLFSDCSQDNFYPYIRVRRIKEIKANKILRKRKG